jgi:hypothetical protein
LERFDDGDASLTIATVCIAEEVGEILNSPTLLE